MKESDIPLDACAATGRPPKQERAVRTRARILDAAAHAFAGKGYPAVTIQDVARLSGITKGAVYFHYANKGALAVAVVSEFYRRIKSLAHTVEQLGCPPLTSVAELLLRTAVALRDDILMQAAARLQIERAMIETELPVPYEEYTGLICGWLESGAREGRIVLTTSPHKLALVLVSAFFGAQHISWVLTERADIVERTMAVVETVIPDARPGPPACYSGTTAG
jgi:AcrR family transcriptional regulator